MNPAAIDPRQPREPRQYPRAPSPDLNSANKCSPDAPTTPTPVHGPSLVLPAPGRGRPRAIRAERLRDGRSPRRPRPRALFGVTDDARPRTTRGRGARSGLLIDPILRLGTFSPAASPRRARRVAQRVRHGRQLRRPTRPASVVRGQRHVLRSRRVPTGREQRDARTRKLRAVRRHRSDLIRWDPFKRDPWDARTHRHRAHHRRPVVLQQTQGPGFRRRRVRSRRAHPTRSIEQRDSPRSIRRRRSRAIRRPSPGTY